MNHVMFVLKDPNYIHYPVYLNSKEIFEYLLFTYCMIYSLVLNSGFNIDNKNKISIITFHMLNLINFYFLNRDLTKLTLIF